ncbi:MAG: Smr/MutS family protein [Prolixibacteraceae bacterium]|nr:Smr/MutS family protein [Prolixibacteraceae bacterium]MBN2648794.1 Smr/MutS family protein [Prolixibacteraceae bacterium]
MQHIYPGNFEQKIGFERIRQIMSNFCLSEMGRENVEKIVFMNDFSKIVYHVSLVDEFLTILKEYDDFPTGHYYDMRGALNKIRVPGTFPETIELFNLRRSLETIRSILSFFNGEKKQKFPNLNELTSDVEVFQQTIKAIDAILDNQGVIKDNASPELREIRSNIFSLQSSISKRMQQIIRQLQVEGIVDEDAAVAMREGRPVIPVAAANKKKISGIVHDESSSGKTAFIEPGAIVEMNNRLRELHNAERREIVKILTTFADLIRPDIDEIARSYVFLGRIDFIRAKAKLAQKFECVKPDLRDEPFFDWHHARHPLLVEALAKEKKEMVPLKIRMDEPNRILLISGPNAGGKSVCLKTVGIIQYMLQCGLLIPLAEGSRVGIFNSIFIDIGDEQSIENDLSTYSSHLMHMKFFTQNCNKNSLVLIDEFGTGTEPMLGGAIAEAVLNRLNKLGTYGIITTHYTNLKHFGSANKGIVNGAMLYNTKEMRPLFQLQIGKPGSSFAFEIARNIGLSEDILKEATDKLGKEHVDYDKNLREIVRDKQYWENKRLRIRKVEKSLDTLSDEYQNELLNTRQMRKEIIAQAKKEAQKIIDDANRTIENTIREIRESQAEKERTKEIRKKLTSEKEKIEQIDPEKEKQIAQKMEQLERRQKTKGKKKKDTAERVSSKTNTQPIRPQFSPGDKIRLKDTGSVGEIIDIDKSKVVVALGNLVSTTTIDKIELISNNEVKRQKQEERMRPKSDSLQRTNSILGKKLDFKPDIDVRGQRADEALSNIQAFIDEAIMVGASKVRILHGKGYGILKDVIRNYLKSEPAVKSLKDEHVQFGGSGITIVELD